MGDLWVGKGTVVSLRLCEASVVSIALGAGLRVYLRGTIVPPPPPVSSRPLPWKDWYVDRKALKCFHLSCPLSTLTGRRAVCQTLYIHFLISCLQQPCLWLSSNWATSCTPTGLHVPSQSRAGDRLWDSGDRLWVLNPSSGA